MISACLPGSEMIVSRTGDTAALELTLDQVHHPGEQGVLSPWHGVLHLQPGLKVSSQLGLTEVSGHYRHAR